MPLRLRVYAGETPNQGNETHLFFKTKAQLLTRLSTFPMTEIANVDLDNYRINNDLIVLHIADQYDEINFLKATYAVEEGYGTGTIEEDFLRCWFVDSVKLQSGNAYLSVRRDLWGSYIKDASFGRLHLTRSNLYGDSRGYYEEAKANGFLNALNTDRESTTYTPSQVSIVFLLSANITQGVFNNDKITRTELFAVTLQECIDACNLTGLNKDGLTAVEMALDIIGGIHGVQSNTGTNEAQASRAWLVPTAWLNYGDVVLTSISVKGLFTNSNGNTISNVRQVVPSFKTGSYDLANFPTFVSGYPNQVVLFGPKYNGFKVPRRVPVYSTKSLPVFYRVTIGQDDVQVVLFNGEDEHDVSQNFEVRLTTANDIANPLQAIARDLSFGLRYARGLTGAYEKQGVSGAALAGFGGIVDNIKPTGIAKANGSGDGFVTWNDGAARNSAHTLKSPYFFMYYETLADEAARAVIKGAIYDYFLDDEESLRSAAANGHFVASSSKETRFYAQADEVLLQGVPGEAVEYVKNEMARGFYYEFLY